MKENERECVRGGRRLVFALVRFRSNALQRVWSQRQHRAIVEVEPFSRVKILDVPWITASQSIKHYLTSLNFHGLNLK